MAPEQQQSCDKAILYCRRAIKARDEMFSAMGQAVEVLGQVAESESRNSALTTFEDLDVDDLNDALHNLMLMKKGM